MRYIKKRFNLSDYKWMNRSICISTENIKTINDEAYFRIYSISSYKIRNKSYNGGFSKILFYNNNYYYKIEKLKNAITPRSNFNNLTLKDYGCV